MMHGRGKSDFAIVAVKPANLPVTIMPPTRGPSLQWLTLIVWTLTWLIGLTFTVPHL